MDPCVIVSVGAFVDDRTFHRRVHEVARHLVPRGTKLVCAVSGGADSVAMLHGLLKVSEQHDCRWSFHVAHLDHQLRAESGDDARFVQEMSSELGLPCTVGIADVGNFSEETGRGIEDAAREMRYQFFADLAAEVGARVVAVGHSADDQAETVLHRIARGTGLRGLSGMSLQRPIRADSQVRLIRPMLGFRRCELRAYLQGRGLAYREDATNADHSTATRNRVRHIVLPMLEKELNPAASQALVQLAEQARRSNEVIRELAAVAMRDICESSIADQCILRARSLAMQPLAIRSECILLALETLDVPFGEIGFERIEAAAELADGDGRLRHIELPGGILVERRGDRLTIRTNTTVASPGAKHATTNPCGDKPK